MYPAATFLVAFCAALCIAALGLLIGILARSEEQAVTFSLIPMFVFAGLGGAWVPLEVTGETFAKIGHVSPVAWAMDGFKNVIIRGFGLESVLVPCCCAGRVCCCVFCSGCVEVERGRGEMKLPRLTGILKS